MNYDGIFELFFLKIIIYGLNSYIYINKLNCLDFAVNLILAHRFETFNLPPYTLERNRHIYSTTNPYINVKTIDSQADD